MIFRTFIVLFICCWYVLVRSIIYSFVKKGSGPGLDSTNQVFSWLVAIPVTGMSILVPTIATFFIIHG